MICEYCSEEILPGERGLNYGSDFHKECLIRFACGSVGHMNKKCSCFGGTEGDPEGMTPRQAAKAATELLLSQMHETMDKTMNTSMQ